MTLLDMLKRNVEQVPEKTAIVHNDLKLTYRELDDKVARLANALTGLGLTKGARVGLLLPRVPELVISFLAIAKVCGIAVPVNFEILEDQIREALAGVSPKCLIVHKNFMGLVKRVVPPGMEITIIVVGGGKANGNLSWEEVLQNAPPDRKDLLIKAEDVVYLNYTSGSTGSSRGAVTTHSHIYWNTFAAAEALRLTAEDIHLCMFAPFAHPHEIFARPLYLGGTMVLLDKIYPKALAGAISIHGVTCMMGLAPMYELLLEAMEHKPYDLGSLRVPESGGMVTRPKLIERFGGKAGTPILPVWGSTETTGIALANIPGEKQTCGSIGKACPTYEVKILTEDCNEANNGETGEMVFKGPAVVSSYYDDLEGGSNNFREGWYYSGDLGKKDAEGNFYFVDRKSGMMKVAGLKVYPLEIELALMEHPGIKEVAVLAAKDRLRGEVPKAIIVTNNGNALSEREVAEFCKGRIAGYKVPRIIEFRGSLPKTGSGKINKKELALEETLRH